MVYNEVIPHYFIIIILQLSALNKAGQAVAFRWRWACGASGQVGFEDMTFALRPEDEKSWGPGREGTEQRP